MNDEQRKTASHRAVVVDDDDDDEYGKSTKLIPKLRIKIKPPITRCNDDDDVNDRKADADADDEIVIKDQYSCSLCGKGFRSRKALGGHMRVHTHQHHQRPNDDVLFDMELYKDVDGGDKDVIRCPICEKDFSSNKALFGHMRCHPERNWRGIQPPPVYNTSSSSTVFDVNQSPLDEVVNGEITDDQIKLVVDLEKDLLPFGWGAKAARGRDAINTKYYSSSSAASAQRQAIGVLKKTMDVEPEQVDGVQSLILLSLGDIGRKLQNSQKQNGQKQNDQLRTDVTKVRSDHDHSETIHGTKRKSYSDLLTSEEQDQSEVMKHKARKYNSMVDNEFKLMSTYNKTLFQPQYSSSPAAVATTTTDKKSTEVVMGRYKCRTCNKCFASHQALGGHKSSHNKIRNNNNNTSTSISCDETAATGSSCTNQPLHQCNVCFKIFPTGQALGHHKRLHCTTTTTSVISKNALPLHLQLRPPVSEKSSIVNSDQPFAPESVSLSNTEKRVCRGFDLNEAPPVEEEDDDHNNTTATEQPQAVQQHEAGL